MEIISLFFSTWSSLGISENLSFSEVFRRRGHKVILKRNGLSKYTVLKIRKNMTIRSESGTIIFSFFFFLFFFSFFFWESKLLILLPLNFPNESGLRVWNYDEYYGVHQTIFFNADEPSIATGIALVTGLNIESVIK